MMLDRVSQKTHETKLLNMPPVSQKTSETKPKHTHICARDTTWNMISTHDIYIYSTE